MNDKETISQLKKELENLQEQTIEQSKLASIGKLTAGIMHEIQNPLNFINNFAKLSTELLLEMNEILEEVQEHLGEEEQEDLEDISLSLKSNMEKIQHNGERANSIIQGILMQSRGKAGVFIPTDINKLITEFSNLAYHGKRAEDQNFNCQIINNFDESIGEISVVPQNFSRVILNLMNNAFYAVNEKQNSIETKYSPIVNISTKKENGNIIISVKDNGMGIPEDALQKIFTPFFSTKPIGKGTGLGLSMSIDIIKNEHKGELGVKTEKGEFTEFIIEIPEIH